jgi:hypothetical protein
MYYVSVETFDPTLPVACSFERELLDLARPELRCALCRLAQPALQLPELIVVVPKSGFDVTPRNEDDAALVYALLPPANVERGTISLAELWNTGVRDWGAITLTHDKAIELQATSR